MLLRRLTFASRRHARLLPRQRPSASPALAQRRRVRALTTTTSTTTSSGWTPAGLWTTLFPHGMTPGFGSGFAVFPLKTFPQRHCVIFGSVFAAIKTGAADYFVQRTIESKRHDQVDWPRVYAFTTFGLLYLGFVQYFLYVPLFTRALFPDAQRFVALSWRQKLKDTAGQKLVAKQVCADLVVHEPFIYFPCFYAVKEYITTGGAKDWLSTGLGRWWNNFVPDTKANWSVWAPAFFINFSLCPMWMRVPFVAIVSMGWTVLLSSSRGAEGRPDTTQRQVDAGDADEEDDAQEVAAVS